MGLEAVIERAIRTEARDNGWKVYKVTFPGTDGAPDRLFGKDGRGVFIEFKAPGEEPTLQQRKRHRELREYCGFEVHWADNIADARRVLGLRESA